MHLAVVLVAVVLILVAILIIVLILIAVLVAILIVVLVLIVILVLVLVIHDGSSVFVMAVARLDSLPRISGFILRFKEDTCKKSENDGCGDASGTGLQSSGEDPQKTVLLHSLLNTFGKKIAESGQWNGSTGTCKFRKGLI